MSERMTRIPKGQRVVITSGEYSSYSVGMMAEAVEDIDIDELRREWLALHPAQAERHEFEVHQFMAWVVNTKHLLVEVSVNWLEWHVDSYGDITNDDEYTVGPWRDGVMSILDPDFAEGEDDAS